MPDRRAARALSRHCDSEAFLGAVVEEGARRWFDALPAGTAHEGSR